MRTPNGRTPTPVSLRDRLRTQLADLKLPGALEALDDILCKYTQIPAVHEQANSRTRGLLFRMVRHLPHLVGGASASRAAARGVRRVLGVGSCVRRCGAPGHDGGAGPGSRS
jgi:hypothetical protein